MWGHLTVETALSKRLPQFSQYWGGGQHEKEVLGVEMYWILRVGKSVFKDPHSSIMRVYHRDMKKTSAHDPRERDLIMKASRLGI